MRLIDADAVKQKYRDRLVKSLVDKDRGIDLSEHAEKLSKSFNRFIDEIAADDDVLEQIRAEIIEMRSKQNCSCSDCLDIIDKYR